MVRTKQNFEMMSGDTQVLEYEVLDEDGVAVNITDATIEWVLTASRNSATALITKTTSSGIVITNGPSGIFQVTLLPANTTSLSGIYYYEAEVTTTGNSVYTVSTGMATIEGDVVL